MTTPVYVGIRENNGGLPIGFNPGNTFGFDNQFIDPLKEADIILGKDFGAVIGGTTVNYRQPLQVLADVFDNPSDVTVTGVRAVYDAPRITNGYGAPTLAIGVDTKGDNDPLNDEFVMVREGTSTGYIPIVIDAVDSAGNEVSVVGLVYVDTRDASNSQYSTLPDAWVNQDISNSNPVLENPFSNPDVTPLVFDEGTGPWRITEAQILEGWTDADGDTLSVENFRLRPGLEGSGLSVQEVEPGVYEISSRNPDFRGAPNFYFTVSDGNGGLAEGSRFVTVQNVNDLPEERFTPVGEEVIALVGVEPNQYLINSQVIKNSYVDADGDQLFAVIDSFVDGYGNPLPGTFESLDDGLGTAYLWTPPEGFEGYAAVTYTIADSPNFTVLSNTEVEFTEDAIQGTSTNLVIGNPPPLVLDGPKITGDLLDFSTFAYNGPNGPGDSDGIESTFGTTITDEMLLAGITDAQGSTNGLLVKSINLPDEIIGEPLGGEAYTGTRLVFSNYQNTKTGEVAEYYQSGTFLAQEAGSYEFSYVVVDLDGNELEVTRTLEVTEYQQGDIANITKFDFTNSTRPGDEGRPTSTSANPFGGSNSRDGGRILEGQSFFLPTYNDGVSTFVDEFGIVVTSGLGVVNPDGTLTAAEVTLSSNDGTIGTDAFGATVFTPNEGFTGFAVITRTATLGTQVETTYQVIEVLPLGAVNETIVPVAELEALKTGDSNNFGGVAEPARDQEGEFFAEQGDVFVEDGALPYTTRESVGGVNIFYNGRVNLQNNGEPAAQGGYFIPDSSDFKPIENYNASNFVFDPETGSFTSIELEVFNDVDLQASTQVISEQDILSLYTDTDGDTLSLKDVSFKGFDPVTFQQVEVDFTYDPVAGTYTRTFDGTDANYIGNIQVEFTVTDGSGLDSAIQSINISDPNVYDNSLVLADGLTATREVFDATSPDPIATDILSGGDLIRSPLGDSLLTVEGIIPDAVAGETITVTADSLRSILVDTDGDAVVLDTFDNQIFVGGSTPDGNLIQGEAIYDSATDSWSIDTTPFAEAGLENFFIQGSFSGGIDRGSAVVQVDFAPESVVEKGVEGVDFLYASNLAESRDNDRIVKRGEDAITGHYWINSRDSSQTDNLVDGQEYAMIMGRRGELTGDLTADEIIGGLESGDFVATKSFTSYGGLVVSSAFEDGAIDALVQSADPNQNNALTIGRIDASTGELLTGFGGALRNVSGLETWDNFAPERTLSGRNDNAYGDILAQQNEQTGGF